MGGSERNNILNKEMKNVALYITSIGAYLYLCGFAVYGGWLSVFHLDSEMFPISIEKLMANGFLALTVRASTYYLWFAVIICSFIFLTFIVVEIIKGAWLKKKWRALKKRVQKKNEQKNDEEKFKDGIQDQLSFYHTVITIPLIFFMVILGSFKLSHDLGSEIAIKKQDEITKEDYKFTTLARVKFPLKDESLISGEIISYSADFTAFYTNEGIKLIPSKFIVSMDITPENN